MWPWGHAAVGYLLYSVGLRIRDGSIPAPVAVVALAVGTQFPDLVDKPLGWTLGVLPGGRTLAHSLFAAAVVVGAVVAVTRGGRYAAAGAAFGVGYLSHLFADGVYAAVDGEFVYLSYLAWPVLPVPPTEVEKSFIAHLRLLEFSTEFYVEIWLVVLALVLWVLDGKPGLALVRAAVAAPFRRARRLVSGE